MKLYNSLSRNVEDLKPLKQGEVSVYSCGPTVYDHAHIGNLRSFIMADTLRRALVLEGHMVRHTMNITDVDDKMIARSQEVFPDLPADKALQELAEKFSQVFFADASAVGIDVGAMTITKATSYIPQMQQLISELLRKEVAYVSEDGVYFSIMHYERQGHQYGVLSNLGTRLGNISRIGADEYGKEEASDFALWKAAKPGEPAWELKIPEVSMRGRPGWFLECSVMSTSTLGQPFDIHTGGVDLRFPHHENEIAQSTAAAGKPFASCFVHNEHLLVDGVKMAKSAGNFHTLVDVIQKGFDPLSFRVLMLQAHYRHQLNFTWESLGSAQEFLQSLRGLGQRLHQPAANGSKQAETLSKWQERMFLPLFADMDTAAVLAELGKLENQLSTLPLDKSETAQLRQILEKTDAALGLDLLTQADITDEQKHLIEQRETARAANDWAKADQLRDELLKQKLGVRDSASGPIWFRTN